MSASHRLVVGVSGASGAVYALRTLEMVRELPDWETHLVVTPAGWLNIREELSMDRPVFESLADVVHSPQNVGASIASGSFKAQAMVVVPCSMRTIAAVAHAAADNLLTRAADVMLKERRRLVLVARETPLNLAHLRNMTAISEMGGIIFPPVPAFYHHPQNLQDLVDHTVMRFLDLCGVEVPQRPQWPGLRGQERS
jgi:4-hydroxy-3-polyprenylbenzoate decarboxylase